MQKIFNFFPLTVYKSTLSLSENEKNEMIEEVRLMEKKSKNLDYKSATKAWTGDTQGFEYLHNNPKFENVYLATGFTGRGLMQAPGIGRALTELITTGSYQSIDISNMAVERVLGAKARPEPYVL